MEYLEDYIENNVEPTLSHILILYKKGKLNDEDYLQLVSELTEIYRDYGEKVEELVDALYSKYADEVEN